MTEQFQHKSHYRQDNESTRAQSGFEPWRTENATRFGGRIVGGDSTPVKRNQAIREVGSRDARAAGQPRIEHGAMPS